MDELAKEIAREFKVRIDNLDLALHWFETNLTKERIQKVEQVLPYRSFNVAAIMEDIYDRGNVAAVCRSLEAHGFFVAHLIETSGRFKESNRVSQGADKWMIFKRWKTTRECIDHLKENSFQIYASDLEASKTIADLDWSQKCAFVLGNEKQGISTEMRSSADALFRIPMYGFTQSFNISVAGALIASEVFRLREQSLRTTSEKSLYTTTEQRNWLKLIYYMRTLDSSRSVLLNKGLGSPV